MLPQHQCPGIQITRAQRLRVGCMMATGFSGVLYYQSSEAGWWWRGGREKLSVFSCPEPLLRAPPAAQREMSERFCSAEPAAL